MTLSSWHPRPARAKVKKGLGGQGGRTRRKALDVIAAVDFEIHSGKITEVTVYQNDAYAFDEFWVDD